jgi:uncharacterized protein (TIGR00255 family)
MLRSMTGFGRGEAAGPDVTVVVEARSVNNRFLDVQVRSPREYMAIEQLVHRAAKAAFRRGRIDVQIKRVPIRSHAQVLPDHDLFHAYLDAVRALWSADGSVPDESTLREFALRQPGVLEVSNLEVDVMSESDVLMTAVETAFEQLQSMRTAEGAELHAEMDQLLLAILHDLDAIEQETAGVQERLMEKLQRRVTKLVGERHEPWRLLQEVALLAERTDIGEEITRLRSHVLQFKDAMDRDEAVGRRLDFLLQEMNREVNTIGSKTSDHPVSRRVVEMKTSLERIREQAANVE